MQESNKNAFIPRQGCIYYRQKENSQNIPPCLAPYMGGIVFLSADNQVARDLLKEMHQKGGFIITTNSFDSRGLFVDYNLPIEDIGSKISELSLKKIEFVSQNISEITSENLKKLHSILFKHLGADFTDYKELTIKRRINRRMMLTKFFDFNKYLSYIETAPNELNALYLELFISVTFFFRDKPAFEILEKELSSRLNDFPHSKIFRIWIPACSTGCEAYSIAMLLDDIAKKLNRNIKFIIFATDIDEISINIARKALYSKKSIENILKYNPEFVTSYFEKKGDYFNVIKPLRESIIFAKQDIIRDPSFSKIDLISCRNLLIYFKSDLQNRIISIFHYSLNSEGLLFLGKSESTGVVDRYFNDISKKYRLFKANSSVRTNPLHFKIKSLRPEDEYKNSSIIKKTKSTSISQIVNKEISDIFGPPSILISNDLKLLYVHKNADLFFSIKSGKTALDVLDLAIPQIKATLSSVIYRARRENKQTSIKNICFKDNHYNIVVSPVNEFSISSAAFIVSFIKINSVPDGDFSEINTTGYKDEYIIELEQELETSRNHLQTTIEDIETANEELQSLNEELQSTNEEFETANEELHAVNEELYTVNEELNSKSAELAETNTYLENILSNMEIPLIVIDSSLKIKKITPPIMELFNISGQNIGDIITNLIDEKIIKNLPFMLDQVISKSSLISKTLDIKNKIYEFKLYPFITPTDRGALIILIDITYQHKHAQEFIALAENSPDIVMRFDRDYNCIYSNVNIENLISSEGLKTKKRKNLQKANISDFGFNKQTLDLWQAALKKVIYEKEETSFCFEFLKNKKRMIFETRIAPELNYDKKVVTFIAVARNITLRHNTQQLLQTIFDNVPVIIAIYDSTKKFTFSNKAFTDILGWTQDDLFSEDIMAKFYPDPDYRKIILKEMEESNCKWKETQIATKSGDTIYTLCSYIRLDKDRKVCIALDVTDKIKFEKMALQKQKIESLGNLAGGIAHDFNNILAAIIGFSQLSIEKNLEGSDCTEELDQIVSAGFRAKDLVLQILAFSQKSMLIKSTFLMNQSVQDSLILLRASLPSSISILSNITSKSIYVEGDKEQIKQIITNLITNANNAINDKSGAISISLSLVDKKNLPPSFDFDDLIFEYACLEISDTGHGIPKEIVSKIFEPYFSTKPDPGSGLGLAVVHGIVKILKGEITVSTSTKSGTTFKIFLPVNVKNSVANKSLKGISNQKIPRGTEFILFVDDEPTIVKTQKQLLSRLGYSVQGFICPIAALKAFTSQPDKFDIVITDMTMPGLTGDQLIKKIRDIKKDIPIILCSGHNDKLNSPTIKELRVNKIIKKPARLQIMATEIRNVLEN